jgi:pyruvate dehydrogenase E2 component (dihydrolipoamide acetyltransferase)
MATTVSMPQLGETVTEGTILRWAKSVGDTIAEDEVLVEISTDKVDTEVPSPAAGVVLEILVEEGETVEVGTELAVIGDADEAPGDGGGTATQEEESAEPEPEQPAEQQPEEETAEPGAEPEPEPRAQPEPDSQPQPESQPEPESEPAPQPAAAGEGNGAEPRLLSPVVRKLAREHDIDLGQVEGSGQGGRITRRDVESYLEQGAPAPQTTAEQPATTAEPEEEAAPQPAQAPEPAPAPRRAEAPSAPKAAPAPAPVAGEGAEEVQLDRLRVRIAEGMARSRQTAAHVWTSVEVDYERVERVRQAHKESFKQEEGFSLTYLPFIARATIDALKAYPVVNSALHLEERVAVMHRNVNLGIAIDLDQQGLIVAGVRDADGLRLVGLARRIRQLADKARAGRLEPDDVTGATFTITNPGPFGSFMSAPIINVPNTGILSTDTVAKRPAVVTGPDGGDMIAIRHIGYLGLSWDHRAFDGSTAVLFLQQIKQNIESWDWEQELD